MSSHTQNRPTQTTVDGSQANFETALRIATVIVEANQRLFKLQSEAANAAFAENSKHLMSSLSTMDSGALLGEWMRAGLGLSGSKDMCGTPFKPSQRLLRVACCVSSAHGTRNTQHARGGMLYFFRVSKRPHGEPA